MLHEQDPYWYFLRSFEASKSLQWESELEQKARPMHQHSPSRRPLSAIVTAAVLAVSSLGFVFAASPASAATTITLANTPTSIELGESFTSSATITGSTGTEGVVNFVFFGPDKPQCGIVFDDVIGAATTDSGGTETASVQFTPTTAGTWRVTATYSTENPDDGSSTQCNDTGSTVTVTESAPKQDITLTTQVSDASITLGESVTDTATLTPPTGGPKPTGNVGFAVYGPDDANCETAIPVGIETIDPNSDTVTSNSFTPSEPGTYRWIGSYHGDDNYNTHLADCNEPNETVVVTDPTTSDGATVTTQVSEPEITMRSGEATFHDTATVTPPADGPTPTGTILFRLYGPDDPDCTGEPVDEQPEISMRSGVAQSNSFTATEPGTYRWTAEYSGDANYPLVARPCNDPNENVLVIDPDGDGDGDPGIVDPDPDGDGGRESDGDEDGDGDGDSDGDSDGDGDGDEGEGEGDEDEGDEGGDLPDTGAQGSPLLLGLGLVLTTAGYIISWRHRPGRSL